MDAKLVKELREKSGAGMMDCKKALVATDGDIQKAMEYLREQGLAATNKKAGRVAAEGVVESYIHMGGKIGVLVEINCETDFVAKTDGFKAFAKDVAMHIAAANPTYVSKEEVPEAEVKNPDITIEDLVKEQIMAIGENVKIRRFARFQLGEGIEKKQENFAEEVAAQMK